MERRTRWTWKRILVILLFIGLWLAGWLVAAYNIGSFPEAIDPRARFTVFFAAMVIVGVLIPGTIVVLLFVELDRRRDQQDLKQRQDSPQSPRTDPSQGHFPH
jgi:hypothetical protein